MYFYGLGGKTQGPPRAPHTLATSQTASSSLHDASSGVASQIFLGYKKFGGNKVFF